MHSTTPPKSPTSPTSASRWKRARPVSARYASPQIAGGAEGTLEEGQGETREDTRAGCIGASDNRADEASLSNALQHMRLGTRAQIMHLTPTARMEAPHTVDTFTDSRIVHRLHATESPTLNLDENHERAAQKKNVKVSGAEVQATLDTEPASQDSTKMETHSDSEYIPSQDNASEIAEQVKEEEDGEEDQDQDQEVEEHIDLEYQIPEDVLRAAMQASPSTRASFWSAKLYRGPEGQQLSTHYCRNMEVAERVAKHFLDEKVLGFDIEWKPFGFPHSIKQNASLIQLACDDRIALFHISLFKGTTPEELMPPTLKIILESPDIYKVGVSIKSDFSRLQKYLNIQAQGVFELSRLHNLVETHATNPGKANNKLVGLAKQVHQHLQLPLYKGEQLEEDPEGTASVRESDWSKLLDLQQVHYAAADAYAGFRLYHMLEWKRKQLRPTPPSRGICDYDAKARPKAPAKKKATGKAKDIAKSTAEQSAPAIEEEPDDGEEEDGYETAPEEPMEDDESEDLDEGSTKQAAALDGSSDNAQTQKRVGRVNLSWLKGPDPGYPILPNELEKTTSSPNSLSNFQYSSHSTGATENAALASDTRLSTNEADEADDEFADPELEQAFQVMDLDSEGKLKEVAAAEPKATPKRASPRISQAEKSSSGIKPSGGKDVQATIEMSDYNPIDLDSEEPTTAPPPTFQPLLSPTDEPSHSPEYELATTWAQEYLKSTIPSPTSTLPSRIRATIPHLRAYHLWHTQQFSIDDIASDLRDPPLSHSTVTGYILQAVQLERLAYDKDAMRELMMSMPEGMRKGRFRWLAERVGVLK